MTLERVNAEFEKFGTTQQIYDEVDRIFANRAIKAVDIVYAALTETPYSPTVDGVRYEVEVSNVYWPGEEDTVGVVAATIKEAVEAEVKGARAFRLRSASTGYRSALKKVWPNSKFPAGTQKVFEARLAEQAEEMGIGGLTASAAKAIVAGAPRKVVGVPMVSRISFTASKVEGNIFTTEGRVIRCMGWRELGFSGYQLDPDFRIRGGKAPGSSEASRIRDYIITERTKHLRR